MHTVLYLTDLYYVAKGRNYYEEDLFITAQLKEHFNVLIAHPTQAIPFLKVADLVIFRNTGAVIGYQAYFDDFVREVMSQDILTFNSFDGKADMKGKQYLLELTKDNYPVIPTIEKVEDIGLLRNPKQYLIKPKNGADSIGLEIIQKAALLDEKRHGFLIQPYIDFEYEVSFYYLNDAFQYALYAPDKQKRWNLETYQPTQNDLEFAQQFIAWNTLTHGIQRVDACRLKDDSLLLVELEDLNPFLSLDLLSESQRNNFIKALITQLFKTKKAPHS